MAPAKAEIEFMGNCTSGWNGRRIPGAKAAAFYFLDTQARRTGSNTLGYNG